MRTNEEILAILSEYSDDYLVRATQDFNLLNIPEDSYLRVLREQCFGEVDSNFFIQVMNLGVLMAVELGKRVQQKNNMIFDREP